MGFLLRISKVEEMETQVKKKSKFKATENQNCNKYRTRVKKKNIGTARNEKYKG